MKLLRKLSKFFTTRRVSSRFWCPTCHSCRWVFEDDTPVKISRGFPCKCINGHKFEIMFVATTTVTIER